LSFGIVQEPLNSILIFGCYTSSNRRKEGNRVKHTEGMRSIDKDPEGIYNAKGGLEKKNGGAGPLNSV
jgi:hypothetical protein